MSSFETLFQANDCKGLKPQRAPGLFIEHQHAVANHLTDCASLLWDDVKWLATAKDPAALRASFTKGLRIGSLIPLHRFLEISRVARGEE
jgi:hypothetical protein